MAAARELVPLLKAHAAEIERLGTPAPEVHEALRAAGFYALTAPRKYGGSRGRRAHRHRRVLRARPRLRVERMGGQDPVRHGAHDGALRRPGPAGRLGRGRVGGREWLHGRRSVEHGPPGSRRQSSSTATGSTPRASTRPTERCARCQPCRRSQRSLTPRRDIRSARYRSIPRPSPPHPHEPRRRRRPAAATLADPDGPPSGRDALTT
jgi:hypothetical protein